MWKWDTTKPINLLPKEISDYFRHESDFLRYDISFNKLKVKKIDAPEPQFLGHGIRVVESRNPIWYSDMFQKYAHVRRDRTMNALERISNFEDKEFSGRNYLYDYRMREIIFNKLYHGLDYTLQKVTPDKGIVTYFNQDIIDLDYFSQFSLGDNEILWTKELISEFGEPTDDIPF